MSSDDVQVQVAERVRKRMNYGMSGHDGYKHIYLHVAGADYNVLYVPNDLKSFYKDLFAPGTPEETLMYTRFIAVMLHKSPEPPISCTSTTGPRYDPTVKKTMQHMLLTPSAMQKVLEVLPSHVKLVVSTEDADKKEAVVGSSRCTYTVGSQVKTNTVLASYKMAQDYGNNGKGGFKRHVSSTGTTDTKLVISIVQWEKSCSIRLAYVTSSGREVASVSLNRMTAQWLVDDREDIMAALVNMQSEDEWVARDNERWGDDAGVDETDGGVMSRQRSVDEPDGKRLELMEAAMKRDLSDVDECGTGRKRAVLDNASDMRKEPEAAALGNADQVDADGKKKNAKRAAINENEEEETDEENEEDEDDDCEVQSSQHM